MWLGFVTIPWVCPACCVVRSDMAAASGLGHNNAKQKIQYHLRLKQELEEMRAECTVGCGTVDGCCWVWSRPVLQLLVDGCCS